MLTLTEDVNDIDKRPIVIWEGNVSHATYRIVINKANKPVVEQRGHHDAMGVNSWHSNVSHEVRCEVLGMALLDAIGKLT